MSGQTTEDKRLELLVRLREEFDQRLARLKEPDTADRIDAAFATDGVRFKKYPKVDESL